MSECRCFEDADLYFRGVNTCVIHGKESKFEETQVVWADDATGLTIQRIHTLDDCMRFGNMMGHCAGQHRLLTQFGAWKFYSVFDDAQKPHSSIHLRTVDAPDKDAFAKFKEEHPDLGYYAMYKFNGYDMNAPWEAVTKYVTPKTTEPEPSPKYSREWYDWSYKVGARDRGMVPIGIDGVPHFILSANVKGQYGNPESKYSQVTLDWYNANRMDELGVVTIPRRGGY